MGLHRTGNVTKLGRMGRNFYHQHRELGNGTYQMELVCLSGTMQRMLENSVKLEVAR